MEQYEAFLAMLQNFKTKAAEFYNAIQNLDILKTKTAQVPELEAERVKLLDMSNVVRGTLDNLYQSIDSSIDWVKNTLGFDSDDATLGNLEAFPLLGVAVVTASLAAITNWLVEYAKFLHKVDAVEKLMAKGVSPSQAYKMAGELDSGVSLVSQLSKALIPLVLIGGAFYLLPKIAPQLSLAKLFK